MRHQGEGYSLINKKASLNEKGKSEARARANLTTLNEPEQVCGTHPLEGANRGPSQDAETN